MGVGCIVLRRQTSIRAVSLTLLLGVSVLSTLLDTTVQMNEQQGASQSSQDSASDGNKKNDNDEKNDDHKWAQISTPFEINYPLHELAYFPLQNIGSFSSICHATYIPSGEQKEIILSTGIIPPGAVHWVEFSVASYISDSVENPRRMVSCASYSQITQTIKNELSEQGIRFLHVMFRFAQLPSSFTLSEDDPTFHKKLVKVWNELGSVFVNRMHYICVVKQYPEEDIQQAVAIKDTFIQKYGIPPSRRDALTKAPEVKAESEEHHDDATEQNEVSDAKKQGGITDDTQLPSQRHLQQPASAGDTSVGTEGTAEQTQPEGDIGVKDDGVEQSSDTEQQDTAQRRIDVDLQQQLDAQRAAAAQLAASQQQRKKRTGVAVGVVFGLLLPLIVGGVALYLFVRRRSVRSLGNPSDPLLDVGNIDTLQLF